MAQDRSYDSIRVTAATKDVRAGKRMLIGRGKHLVVEIVKQTNESPLIDVSVRPTVAFSTGAHGRLYSQSVFTQAIALGVLAEQFPGISSIGHRYRVFL